MAQTLRVEVTEEDIKAGERGNPEYCPIAHALCRAELMDTPWVDSDSIEDQNGDKWDLPAKARAWIQKADRGELVHPMIFTARRSAAG